MIDVETCNTSCKMMGEETSLPVFISPAGMAGLAHPEGERVLAKAAGECGIIQMVSDRGGRVEGPRSKVLEVHVHSIWSGPMDAYHRTLR